MEIVIKILVLNFALVCFAPKISAHQRGNTMNCIKFKKVTIVTNIPKTVVYHFKSPKLKQQGVLIKLLLRDSCTEVWMYSRNHKYSIRMMESNVQHFLDTENAFYNFMDENEFIEFASKLPEVKKPFEQTLLYMYWYSAGSHKEIGRMSLVSR